MRTMIGLTCLFSIASFATAQPRQLTFDAKNHALDNNDNFSPDDRFLAYDTRSVKGLIMEGRTIEKIEIATGKVTVLYNAPDPISGQGPGVGAVSYHPLEDRMIFIHGPLTGTGLTYDLSCRYGAVISGSGDGRVRYADARDTTKPYTVGALRGGTHRHEYDGTGQWVGFTYNDVIMKALDVDLRTIGVTRVGHPIQVDKAPGNMDGDGFSALVVHVVPNPKRGSDEISRADGDSWVGKRGYKKPDGKRQLARAFIGATRDKDGRKVNEVFIVDIPEDVTSPGPLGPLEGTDTAFPAPCAGASQRRLTHTENSDLPGCKGTCRTDHEGQWIAFTASAQKGPNGTQQMFLISPNGGAMKQISSVPGGIADGPRWMPSGKSVLAVDERGRLIAIPVPGRAHAEKPAVLLDDGGPVPYALVVSHDGKTVAFNRDIVTDGKPYRQIFVLSVEEGKDGMPLSK